MPTLLPVRTCDKNIGRVTGFRYSLKDAKCGEKVEERGEAKRGKSGKAMA